MSLNPDESPCGCGGIDRRELLRVAGLGSLALLAGRFPATAGPFQASDFEKQIPADKKLHPDWVRSLFERGSPTVYRGDELKYIGMPVGGLCAGQLYLGGDGKLWGWDLFNQHVATGDGHYAYPPVPASPLEQGFALRITASGKTETRMLDRTGFAEVSFRGEYPIGTVEYRDPGSPVAVTLEAFSPFIPLSPEDSSLPATILRFTVRNTSGERVKATLAGWLENAVCLHHRSQSGTRRNRIVRDRGMTFLSCSAEPCNEPEPAARPDILFEDWSGPDYTGWKVEGTAFGDGPVKRSAFPAYQGDVGGDTERVVNSHATAPGRSVQEKDAATGSLTSRPFPIERRFIRFWIGGGAHRGKTCINLVVDGKVERSATGANDNRMALESWDVRPLQGRQAHLEIVDAESGGWGNVGVGRITFSDRPAESRPLEELPDFGTMGLALLGTPAEHALASTGSGGFEGSPGEEAAAALDQPLIGALGRKLRLKPGQSATVEFVLVWRFPNLELKGLGRVGRHYAVRFPSAQAVARYVADHRKRLVSGTRLWRDTWYDSTLPYWFLDRTFLNTSILATSTAFRFEDGRFYGWEGVGCCPGTCTHVWHYAQAPARLFPELERDTRERVDLGLAFDPETGVMGFRAEFDRNLAVDGQAGTLLRCYREHQMSPDDAFLKRNWSRIRKAFEPLLRLDPDAEGVLEGAQMNTLDQPWFGKIAWLSSLYVAALRACQAMAREMGDAEFAGRCARIVERGATQIDRELFNGEYYVHVPDAAHARSVGSHDGCEIDQVFGQSWAHQVGLGSVLPGVHVRSALEALWKYNFTPDVGPFRSAHKPGRWYAMPGEAGLIMCTWPRGEGRRLQQGFDYYFNECMTGFEYQVAGHMLREGMLTEGLAITRAIHDRYHASRRNPWNEVECGDHYARAMASYGVFLATCGYEHHGPKGHLAFAPRLTPEDFRAAFTTAEGWGTYSQKVKNGTLRAAVRLRWGRLRLKTLALPLPQGVPVARVRVTLDGRAVRMSRALDGERLTLTMTDELLLAAGQKLEVRVS